MKKRFLMLAMSVALGFTMQSCSDIGICPWEDGHGGGDNPTDSVNTDNGLKGTAWRLQSFSYDPADSLNPMERILPAQVPDDQEIILRFDNNNAVSGQAVCNQYTAGVRFAAKGLINFSPINSTKMMCQPGSLDQDYYLALQAATQYTVADKQLRIIYQPEISIPEIGRRMLVFKQLQ